MEKILNAITISIFFVGGVSAFADCRLEVSDEVYSSAYWTEFLAGRNYFPIGKSALNKSDPPGLILYNTDLRGNSPSLMIRDRTGSTLLVVAAGSDRNDLGPCANAYARLATLEDQRSNAGGIDARLQVEDRIYNNGQWMSYLVNKGFYPVGLSEVNGSNLPTFKLVTRYFGSRYENSVDTLDLFVLDQNGFVMISTRGVSSSNSDYETAAMVSLGSASVAIQRLNSMNAK